MEPLISVIVPVYKVEKYLDQCVQSIVDQTYKNLEIILVDDGSPDNCPRMCDAWAEKDPRIKVIHKPNGGSSSARNAGLDFAHGEYFGFVDSDDFIVPEMYEVLMGALEGQSVKVSCCSPNLVSDDGIFIRKGRMPDMEKMDVKQALDAIFTLQAENSLWSKLYRREVFDDIRMPLGEINEDFPILIPSIVNAGGMIHVRRYMYNYRQRIISVTKQTIPNEKQSIVLDKNLRIMKQQLLEYGLNNSRAFGFFVAQYSYWWSILYAKKYNMLTEKLKKDYRIYRKIMKKYWVTYLCSRHSSIKDKILYTLVATNMLLPVYRLFRRECL